MTTIRYPRDFTIRLIASIVGGYIVTRYGGDDSLLELLLTKVFYIEFGATLAITFLAIELIYRATLLLDKHFDWHQRPFYRIPLQVLLGIALPTLVTFLMAALYFRLYGVNILDTTYHLYALPFIAALISIFNLVYYIRYQHAERSLYHPTGVQHAPLQQGQSLSLPVPDQYRQEPGENVKSAIMVHTPTRSFSMPVAEIAYFYRDQGRVFLRPFEGNDYILSQSLDAIEGQLDKEQFFRAARHMIINHKAIKSYQPLLYGKLALDISPAFKEEVNVSKPLARTFKNWLDR